MGGKKVEKGLRLRVKRGVEMRVQASEKCNEMARGLKAESTGAAQVLHYKRVMFCKPFHSSLTTFPHLLPTPKIHTLPTRTHARATPLCRIPAPPPHLLSALSACAALDICDLGFFTMWASSSTTLRGAAAAAWNKHHSKVGAMCKNLQVTMCASSSTTLHGSTAAAVVGQQGMSSTFIVQAFQGHHVGTLTAPPYEGSAAAAAAAAWNKHYFKESCDVQTLSCHHVGTLPAPPYEGSVAAAAAAAEQRVQQGRK